MGNGKGWISGFGGPFVEFSGLGDELAIGGGGGGAVIFNNTLFIGGYGTSYYLNRRDFENFQDVKLDFGHGGLWLGYIHRAENIVHGGFSTKFGWGSTLIYDNTDFNLADDRMFVIQPQVEVELNLTLWFKLNMGIGYRYVSGVDNDILTSKEVNGFAGTLSFIFGWFKPY